MRRVMLGLALFAAALWAAAPAVASAANVAPQYVSSDPEDGAELHDGAPERVSFTFSEPLDDSSEIQVRDECGRRVDDGKTEVELNSMSVALAQKPSGRYEAFYKARGVGGLTGESLGGITFTVHGGPSCGGASGGHGQHGNGEPNKNGGHEGHGGNGSGKHEGMNHGGTGSGSSRSHSGSHAGGTTGGHSGAHAASGGGHVANGGGGHGEGHGPAHKDGNNEPQVGGGGDREEPTEPSALAAPGDAPLPAPEGSAVLLALAACAGVGLLGGWVVRTGGKLQAR